MNCLLAEMLKTGLLKFWKYGLVILIPILLIPVPLLIGQIIYTYCAADGI
jgi:hypothetical protein